MPELTPTDGICSTPEGIEAAITDGYEESLERIDRCSTPEGIEAAITPQKWHILAPRPGLLNARGHRGGDHAGYEPASYGATWTCSTPEGIEAAITTIKVDFANAPKGCSTPEGIEAAITIRHRHGV